MFAERAARLGRTLVFVNQVGGNDELVFDGGSFVADPAGRIRAALPLFEPALQVVDLDASVVGLAPEEVEEPEGPAQLEAGLVLGIRDYFRKQGLPPGAVVAVSGGLDSAITAHLAVLALGAERVLGIAMPGPFSSEHSLEDALALGRNLGIEIRTAIEDADATIERLRGAQERVAEGTDVEQELKEIERALITDETISSYPQPMLRDQMNYLYRNSQNADQEPGADMYERLEVLVTELEQHKERLQRLIRMVTDS